MNRIELKTTIDESIYAEIQRIARINRISEEDVVRKILLKHLSSVGLGSEPHGSQDDLDDNYDHVMVSFAEIQAEMEKQEGHSKQRLALVVEDDLTNMFYIERILQRNGYSIIGAHNGNDAIEQMQKHGENIDVVLMDLHMPVCDGFEAMEKIKRLDPGLSRIPIIVVTANADQAVRQKCMSSGIKDFILKPYKAEKLELALSGLSA